MYFGKIQLFKLKILSKKFDQSLKLKKMKSTKAFFTKKLEEMKMRNFQILILVGLILFLWKIPTTVAKSSKKKISLDNESIHSYQNQTGKWLFTSELKPKLDSYLNEIGTNEEEFRKINSLSLSESIPASRPLFFPFGKDYLSKIASEGQSVESIESDYRELIWPVGTKNSKISSKLGLRRNAMHNGIDIACPNKSPILAAADGLVVVARNQGNYGMSITIQHENNQIQTVYAHNSFLLVKEGELVQKGQIIAFSGSTGHSTGPHLHFEVRYQNIVLNPEHYFPDNPVDELLTKN